MTFRNFLLSLIAGAIISSSAVGAESAALPEPLTLDAALQQADHPGHFENLLADQALQQSIAEAEQTDSTNDVTVNLSGRLREIQRTDMTEAENDSAIKLFVRKPLYDFGKTRSANDLSRLNIELKKLEKQYLIEQRKLSIRKKYFDVLNADNQYLRDNEELAIGFIRFDRTRDNQKLGLASELDVLESRTAYERIRQNRYNSENMQRLTRTLLAEELGYANTPPNELAMPVLKGDSPIGDDLDAMVDQAMRHSLRLKIARKNLQIAKQQIELARHTDSATLDAELEVADYVRESSSRDDWRASINFDVPLYSGGIERSAVKLASAKYQQQLAELGRVQSETRIEVLQLWQAIRQNALKVEGETIDENFRDLTLDRSRTEYELEFKTDLGNSMVQFSESRKNAFAARFALDLSWHKLQSLLGENYLDQIKQPKEGNKG